VGEKLQETSRDFQVAAVLACNVLAARADFEQHSEEDIEAGDADLAGAGQRNLLRTIRSQRCRDCSK
jgi:hypothetical protein